jgi:hypothetical protein
MSEVAYKTGPGRPAKIGGTDRIHASINGELGLFWRLQLLDPLTGKIPNGALSSLVARLLREEARKLGYQGI